MRTMYIECNMGAAGDMLAGALLDLMDAEERRRFTEKVNSLGIPGVCMRAVPSEKQGIRGTRAEVTVLGTEEGFCGHDDEVYTHGQRSMEEIEAIVSGYTDVSRKTKKDILAVYRIIADAESRVHGVPVSEVHFHEVGAMDAVADITAVCMLMDMFAPDRIVSSPVNTGRGFVHCAHGVLPVPAPATAVILKGIPSYPGDIESELCTPTGAALLKYFADDFGGIPHNAVCPEGFGMGKKDFETPNCVRIFLEE